MKKRSFVFVLLAAITVIVYLIVRQKSLPTTNLIKAEPTASAPVATRQTLTNNLPIIGQTANNDLQPPPYSAPLAERVAWWKEMGKKDWHFEYKMPISFYGKVVDEDGNIVSGANIEFSWTDLSPEGTSQRNTISDGLGLFSLTGATGKSLTVRISKRGYKPSHSQNRHFFEFGILETPDRYYSPDPMNPVVFVMRKDRQGEALIVRSRQEAKLESGGQGKSFPIGRGDVFVTVERLPDETPNARYWNARVTVPDGGLQLTTEEFPFEAPEEGYTNNFVITNGLSVQGNTGGMFYVKTSKGYGRVMIYYVPNMPWIYAESWFNPNPVSRNLEVDPSKVEIIRP